ncbi:hypothetical protein WCLP8_860002 [uncultured Gammaproteobacteria bacterium]
MQVGHLAAHEGRVARLLALTGANRPAFLGAVSSTASS